MLKIVIFSSAVAEFEKQKTAVSAAGFMGLEFLFGNSKEKTREQLINENQKSWLLFLDHDCIPAGTSRLEINMILAGHNGMDPVVYAGKYDNPVEATSLQRAHNGIANTWLEQSYSDPKAERLLLGGIFLIFAAKPVELPRQKFWGAEDKLLAKHLKEAGYEMHLSPAIKAIHDTSKSFGHFVRRAILHGRHDALYFEKPFAESQYDGRPGSKIFYWIRKTDFSDLRLAPLILLHFCIQKGAKAVQKALRMNKR